MVDAGFPLIDPAAIAAAVVLAVTSGETGRCWVCQPGRDPVPYDFRGVPGPRTPGDAWAGPTGNGRDDGHHRQRVSDRRLAVPILGVPPHPSGNPTARRLRERSRSQFGRRPGAPRGPPRRHHPRPTPLRARTVKAPASRSCSRPSSSGSPRWCARCSTRCGERRSTTPGAGGCARSTRSRSPSSRASSPPSSRRSWRRSCCRSPSDAPSESELRLAQAQLVGWLEGLFHGIQASLFTQQAMAQSQLDEVRRRRALEASQGMAPMAPGAGPGDAGAGLGESPGGYL